MLLASLIPSRWLLIWLAAWTALGLAPTFLPELTDYWLCAGAALCSVALHDAIALYRQQLPHIQRLLAPALPLGAWCTIRLHVRNPNDVPLAITLFDHYPTAAAEVADLPQHLELAAHGWAEVQYRVHPIVRGTWSFAAAQIRMQSRRGLWQRDARVGETQTVRVYPDFAAIAQYIRLSATQRQALMGIHQRRRRGSGQSFHQLREYQVGDSLRQIDWKATARTRKLIAREYQEERHQTVLFLLDCSRRMRAQDDELSHFDHALNAMILLAYVALHQGDAVGVQSFGGEQRWLLPRSGAAMLKRLIHVVHDLQPTLQAPDYAEVARLALHRQRKRALLVLLTNLRDEDQDDLRPAITLLRQRHLLLIANLREPILDELLSQPLDDLAQAQLYATTCHYQLQRERVHNQLRQLGSLMLDVPPQRLAAAIVNQYLDIKRGARL